MVSCDLRKKFLIQNFSPQQFLFFAAPNTISLRYKLIRRNITINRAQVRILYEKNK